MKPFLYILSLGLLIGGSACSRGDGAIQNPHNYKSTASRRAPARANDRREYKEFHHKGLNIDTKANNPYQFRTVKAPKKYKYSKGGE